MKIAADSMGMPMKEFLKEIERGNVEATNFVKVFSKAFGDFADPAYREAQKKTFFQFSKFMSEFDRFKISIFKSGLGDTLSSIFMSLRHALKLITPVAEGVAQAISIAFHTATADIRLTVAWLLDVAEALGLVGDEVDEGRNWVATIAGFAIGIVAAVAKVKLLLWALKGVKDILAPIGRLFGKVMPTTGAAGAAAGAAGGAARAAGGIGARAIPVVGTALIASSIVDPILNALIGDTEIGKWMKDTTLGDLWKKISPEQASAQEHLTNMSATSVLQKQVDGTITLRIEGDDSKLVEAIKVVDHSGNMQVLSNMGW